MIGAEGKYYNISDIEDGEVEMQNDKMPLVPRTSYPDIVFESDFSGFQNNPSERLIQWADAIVAIQQSADLAVLAERDRLWTLLVETIQDNNEVELLAFTRAIGEAHATEHAKHVEELKLTESGWASLYNEENIKVRNLTAERKKWAEELDAIKGEKWMEHTYDPEYYQIAVTRLDRLIAALREGK
jgi:hypothetical protein